MSEPIYTIPRDARLVASLVPLSEIVSWPDQLLHISDAWKQTAGEGEVCCILDTGCDTEHPDLQGAIVGAQDFTGSRYRWRDAHRHGTWCAGAIAARANDTGIRGIAHKSTLLIAKVLGDNGAGGDQWIASGLQWGLQRGATFFSMSLGSPQPMGQKVTQLLAQAVSSGRFPFAAAGNDGGQTNYPAADPSCLSIGAYDADGNLTEFTSSHGRLDTVAPGVELLSCAPNNGYAKMTGTSMATPIACGVGMLAVAKHKKSGGATDLRSVADMRDHLKRTGEPMAGGFTRLRADRLTADEPGTPPAPSPDTQKPVFQLGNFAVYIPARKGDPASLAFSADMVPKVLALMQEITG